MAAIEDVGRSFSIGTVASLTFEVLGRHFVLFLCLGLIAVVPQEYMNYSLAEMTKASQPAGSIDAMHLWLVGGAWLLAVIMSFLLQAALAYGAVMDLSGQRMSFSNAIMTAVRAFFPLLGLSILYTIAMAFGFALLIIPGLMLFTAWSVAVPSLVVERIGVFDAVARSGVLTKGHRWAILGLAIVFGIAAGITQFLIRPIFGLSLITPGHLPLAYLAADGVVNAVIAIVSATGVACIYFALRSDKEGIGPQQLASVFD